MIQKFTFQVQLALFHRSEFFPVGDALLCSHYLALTSKNPESLTWVIYSLKAIHHVWTEHQAVRVVSTLIPNVLHSGVDNDLMKQDNAFNHQKTKVTGVNLLYHFALPWECFHGKQTQNNKWKQKGCRALDLPSIMSQVKSLVIKNFNQTFQDHPDYIIWFTWSVWHHSKPLR